MQFSGRGVTGAAVGAGDGGSGAKRLPDALGATLDDGLLFPFNKSKSGTVIPVARTKRQNSAMQTYFHL
jgi:hypothetical protein